MINTCMRSDLPRFIRPHPSGWALKATAPAHYRVDSDVERGVDHVAFRGLGIRGSAMVAGKRPRPSSPGDGYSMVGEMVVGGGGMTISE